MSDFWKSKRVAVLGGGALIGSHLVEALLRENPANLWVADNFSTGKREWLPKEIADHAFECDLRDPMAATLAVRDVVSQRPADVVFHLASRHGGRGYVAGHASALYDNLSLDTLILRACAENGVGKVVFASSGCAYPVYAPTDPRVEMRLSEDAIDLHRIEQPDGPYGIEKVVGERLLDAYTREGAFKGVACRMYAVYGPRIGATHAIGAWLGRSLLRQDPFAVWGDGQQKRSWTYVTDTVRGLLLAAERLESGAVNIGESDYWTPMLALAQIWKLLGWQPRGIELQLDRPTGPATRLYDTTKAREQLGWTPEVSLRAGLESTLEWFRATYSPESLRQELERKLTEL